MKRWLLKLFRNKNILVYCELLMTLLIIFLLCIFMNLDGKSLINKIEISVFLGVVIGFITNKLIAAIFQIISSRLEDINKLTDDYETLIKKYESEKLIDNDSEVVFPVKLEAILREVTIEIVDNQQRYECPELIATNMISIMSAHNHSNIYNQMCIRLDDFTYNSAEKKLKLHTSRTTYFDSLLTNRALDYDWGQGVSIRDLYECGPYLNELPESKLSNHIGFNGFVETSDNKFIFVKRNNKVSVGKNMFGVSVNASLKTKYALDDRKVFTTEKFIEAIAKEIEDELNVSLDGEQLTTNNIIALYRDVTEGGKPQFLFYVKIDLSSEEVLKNFKSRMKGKKSANIQEKMKVDGEKLIFIDRTALADSTITPGKLVIKKDMANVFNMIPGASESIVILLKYLNNKES